MTGVLFCDQEASFFASFLRHLRGSHAIVPHTLRTLLAHTPHTHGKENAPNICQWRAVNAFSPHWRLSTNLCWRRFFLSTCYYLIQHFHSVLSQPFIFLLSCPCNDQLIFWTTRFYCEFMGKENVKIYLPFTLKNDNVTYMYRFDFMINKLC